MQAKNWADQKKKKKKKKNLEMQKCQPRMHTLKRVQKGVKLIILGTSLTYAS